MGGGKGGGNVEGKEGGEGGEGGGGGVNASVLLPTDESSLAVAEARDARNEELRLQAAAKKAALNGLLDDYSGGGGGQIPRGELERCVLSLADNNSFIAANRTPVDRMIHYLETCFNPDDAGNDTDKANMNLRITEGAAGSCLSHSHTTQYYFVYQTLSLWREIMDKVGREVNDEKRSELSVVHVCCVVMRCVVRCVMRV